MNKTFVLVVVDNFFYLLGVSLSLVTAYHSMTDLFLQAGITSLYFSSYVYITQDWSVQEWTYSNSKSPSPQRALASRLTFPIDTQTMAICVFGVIAGFMFRWLQRYKMLTIMGFAIIVIGQGLLVDKSGVRSGARLILSQGAPKVFSGMSAEANRVWVTALTGIGGAYSSIGSSVRHPTCTIRSRRPS